MTYVLILNCSVAVDYLQQKRAALTVKWGCENIRITDSFERKKKQSLSLLVYLFL